MHVAVTTRLSGEDPHEEKVVGLTANETTPGRFDVTTSVTGEICELQVNESGRLPSPVSGDIAILRGFTSQDTLGGLLPAFAK